MKTKNNIIRWFFLFFAILLNSFVLLYSALSPSITNQWTSSVTDFFASIVNTFTEKEIITIPITSLDVHMTSAVDDPYNNVPGYSLNQIPLGSAKSITCSYLPENATDASVNYYTDKTEYVSLSQNGNSVSITGLKTGTATIFGKNTATGIVSSCSVTIIDAVAPKTFEISLENNEIEIGSQETICFDIDGGVLGHNELINSRYYDIRKLSYISSNETVASIDQFGVIKPLSVGQSTISVSNGTITKSIEISVKDGSLHPDYLNLNIQGSNICYENEMILDQNSGTRNHQLDVFDGEDKLNPNDFVWTSSNELLVRVDNYGKFRGFRKSVVDDETATITATSKLTNQSVSYEVVVKERQLESMYFSVNVGSRTLWNPEEFTACVGDAIEIKFGYNPVVSNKAVTVESTKGDAFEITNQGTSVILKVLKTGSCDITITSLANPTIVFNIHFSLLKAGAIATDDFADVGHNLRKVVGHAFLFGLAQVFTLLSFLSFLRKNEIWKNGAYSLSVGLVIAIISEIIQVFNPGRTGTLLDVLIDFSGVVVGALLVILVITTKELIQKRKAIGKVQS